jgi:hypothetical protein
MVQALGALVAVTHVTALRLLQRAMMVLKRNRTAFCDFRARRLLAQPSTIAVLMNRSS